MVDFEALGKDALPTSDDDYGSERQLAAENKFFAELSKAYPTTFSEDGDGEFAMWALKATSEEYINHALDLVRKGEVK